MTSYIVSRWNLDRPDKPTVASRLAPALLHPQDKKSPDEKVLAADIRLVIVPVAVPVPPVICEELWLPLLIVHFQEYPCLYYTH
jgi:hypothetical protein